MADAPPSRSTACPRRRGVPEGHLALEEICADLSRRRRDLLRRAAARGMNRRGSQVNKKSKGKDKIHYLKE